MSPEEILNTPAKVLTQKQREAYFEDGYLLVESFIEQEWLEKLRGAVDNLVERSRERSESDSVFDLEPNHSAEEPRLRRVRLLDPGLEERARLRGLLTLADDQRHDVLA